jgi:hypothetical protein
VRFAGDVAGDGARLGRGCSGEVHGVQNGEAGPLDADETSCMFSAGDEWWPEVLEAAPSFARCCS